MNSEEIMIPVPGGEIAVVDHRGQGRDVLLIHDIGFSAAYWVPTIFELHGRCRVVAMDLRGHAHSTAQVSNAREVWEDIGRVIEHLGLDHPLVVSHNLTGYYSSAIGRNRPDLVGGVLLIGGAVTYTRDRVFDMITVLTSEGLLEDLANRFAFGRSGSDPAGRQELLDWLVKQAHSDWTQNELGDDAIVSLEREMPLLPDGSWFRQPTPETIANMWNLSASGDMFPCIDLYENYPIPLWVLHPNDGPDAENADATLDVIKKLRLGRFMEIQARAHTPVTNAEQTADMIMELAAFVDTLQAGQDVQPYYSARASHASGDGW